MAFWSTKILPFLKDKGKAVGGKAIKSAAKNYRVYKFIKSTGLMPQGNDYEAIYNKAIYKFETDYVKHPVLVSILAEKSARESFKKDYESGGGDNFWSDIDANMAAKDKYQELRELNIDWQREIDQFTELFSKQVEDQRSLVEVSFSHELAGIRKQIEGIVTPTGSIDLSEHIAKLAELLDTNRPAAAIDLLNKFKAEKWDKLTPDLKYKLTANVALANFELRNIQEAARGFIGLLDFQVNLKDAYGFAALGFAMLGQNTEAVNYADRAIVLDPQNTNAYQAILWAKDATLDYDSFDKLIPATLQGNEAIGLQLAMLKNKLKDFSGSTTILEDINSKHLKNDYFKVDLLNLLAQNTIESQKTSNFFSGLEISDESRQELMKAKEYLTEAWGIANKSDLRKSRWYILAHRGVTNRMLDNVNEARKDFEEAIRITPSFFIYRNYFQLMIEDDGVRKQIINEVEKLDLTDEEKQQFYSLKLRKLSGQET